LFRSRNKTVMPMVEGHCFLSFIFLLPCLAMPCPALAPALPCFEFSFCCQGQEEEVIQGTSSVFFPFAARDRRRKLHRELFFLLLLGTGGGSYTLHCPPGSAIEFVTGLCRTDNHVTDRYHTVAFIYKIVWEC
jgi:hypothetical protein